MIIVTTTQVRPADDILFFIDTIPATAQQLQELVNASTNMLEPPTFELSADGLTHTSIAKYTNREQLNAFLTEFSSVAPTFFPERETYSDDHAITITRDVVEV